MRTLGSKYIRILVTLLVVVLVLLGWGIFQQSGQGETSIELKPSLSLANSGSEQAHSVQNEANHLKTAVTRMEQDQDKHTFVNADQLCADFASKSLGKLDTWQFAEALLDHIQSSDHAIEDWLLAVASSGSPRQKGAALSLLVVATERAIRRERYARTPNCEEVKECSQQLRELVRSKSSPFAYALVNSAIYESDPMLYRMAHNICQGSSFAKDAICGRVDAMQWLQREPDNGAAATYALAEIKLPSSGMDSTVFENALYRLSLAKRFDYYFDVGNELPPLPSALDDYQHRTELESIRYYFLLMSPIPPYRNIISGCTGEYPKNSNRRFTCIAIANQYLRENASFFDRTIFLALADNLAWDKAKLHEIREDVDVVRSYLGEKNRREALQVQNASGQVNACHLNLKQFADIRQYASKGEFKHYQQEASEFDIKRDELIKITRRVRERR